MTRGRKSRCGKIALGLISALLCAVALTPASALAAGDCEYCVDIPNGNGGGDDPSANASGNGGGSDSATPAANTGETTPATDTGETTDSSDDSGNGGAGAGGGDGKGGKGDEEAIGGKPGDRYQDSLAPADENAAPASSSGSDDGGFPVILVAIAVLAAAGVGFAAWRLRRGDDEGGGVGRPAETGRSA